MKKSALLLLALLLMTVSAVSAAQSEAQTPEQLCAAALPAAEPATRQFTQAEQVLQPDVDYQAIFCTDAGPVYIDLFEKETPITVNNFVFLAQSGYYNNTTFHRVIQDFMAQGGDPTASGGGGPSYQFGDEFVKTLRFDQPGRLAMANAGPGTNGSQFFITTVPTPHLNDLHTIFGQVIQGQANVRKIQLRDPNAATEPGTALNTVLVITDPTTVLLPEKKAITQEETVTAMDALDGAITPDIANILENQKGVFTTEEVIASVAEASREAFGKLLTDNHHQYRVSSHINNKACDVSTVQFISVGYTLDAFATPADAAAEIADPLMSALPLENGFSDAAADENLPFPLFTTTTTGCDQPVIQAMTFWQRGSFVVTAEITIPAEDNAQQQLGLILSEFVGQRLYEPFLMNILFLGIE